MSNWTCTSSSSSSTTATTRSAVLPCEKDVVSNNSKARQFVERVIRLQIETCYGTRGGGDGTANNKDAFLHFIGILQNILQQKDPATLLKVKTALQECAQRKAQSSQGRGQEGAAVVAGYETVAATMASTLICLQQIVRPAHWKRAVDHMKQQHRIANNDNSFAGWSLIESIAMEDMIFFTQRLLEKQNEFRTAIAMAAKEDEQENKDEHCDHHQQHHRHHPLYVDIGVHYTKYSNLDRIQVNGLLSRNERGKIGILAERFNGDVHGNGIYTGTNPYAYSDFGDVGILVARLRGTTIWRQSGTAKKGGDVAATRSTSAATTAGGEPVNYNSIVVGNGYSQMVVLGESSQCIPLLHYPRSMVDKKHNKAAHYDATNDTSNGLPSSPSNAAAAGSCAILYYQEELQKIVDEFFNEGIMPRKSTSPPPPPPSRQSLSSSSQQHRKMDATSRQASTTTARMATSVKDVVYQIVYSLGFMVIVGTIVSISVSMCLFMVNTMSSLTSSSRFTEL